MLSLDKTKQSTRFIRSTWYTLIITLRVFYGYERSRDSSVSTVTRQWTARPEIRIPTGTIDFLSSKTSRPSLGTTQRSTQ
jgi:hypothetical protein